MFSISLFNDTAKIYFRKKVLSQSRLAPSVTSVLHRKGIP